MKRTDVNEMIRLLNQLDIRVLNTLLFQNAMTPIRYAPNHLNITSPSGLLIMIVVYGGCSSFGRLERCEGI